MSLAKEIRSTAVASGELAICWLGQSGFLLKDSRSNILAVDPYLTNCGERMRGFKRLSPMLLHPEELQANYYVTTHLHFDHFDYDAIPIVAQNGKDTLFLGPTSCIDQFQKMGIPERQRCRLDREQRFYDQNITIQGVLANHGEMAPDAIGILLEMGGHRLYFSGDTAFSKELFQAVSAFTPNLAVVSVNGHFGNMDAREGAEAALLTGAALAIPCHCWTFAEHGGDPGEFCEILHKGKQCRAVCFRQGEIQILNSKNQFEQGKETA